MGSSRRFKLEPTVRNSSVKSNSVAATSRFADSEFGFFPAYSGMDGDTEDCLDIYDL
jgi:hypothetical protein